MRLRGGTDSSNGRVEVCQFGTWGAVCSDVWNDNNARVVCGQLGYDPQGLCRYTYSLRPSAVWWVLCVYYEYF